MSTYSPSYRGAIVRSPSARRPADDYLGPRQSGDRMCPRHQSSQCADEKAGGSQSWSHSIGRTQQWRPRVRHPRPGATLGRSILLLALAGAGAGVAGCDAALAQATWRVDPAAHIEASSEKIPVLVREAGCASGVTVTDRIVSRVSYSADVVTIDIRAKRLSGNQTCQSVESPFVVELREPLGGRQLRDRNR